MSEPASLSIDTVESLKDASCVIFEFFESLATSLDIASAIAAGELSIPPAVEVERQLKNLATAVYAASVIVEHNKPGTVEVYAMAAMQKCVARSASLPQRHSTSWQYASAIARNYAFAVGCRIEREGIKLDPAAATVKPAEFDRLAAKCCKSDAVTLLTVLIEEAGKLAITSTEMQELIVMANMECAAAKATNDTKSDTEKKSEKKRYHRQMNTEACDCARIFKQQKGLFPMKIVVQDYVEKHGGSFASIMRILNDNPDQWKSDTKAT